jgi:exosortase
MDVNREIRRNSATDRLTVPAWSAILAVWVCCYYSTLAGLVGQWWTTPDYHHCFVVPLFAGYLLWARRRLAVNFTPREAWWGLGVLATSVLLRWASVYFYYGTLDPLSLLPSVAGLALLFGGWRCLNWAWPSIFFLVFMIPIPATFAGILSQPLQRIGTIASTFAIQTLGIFAQAEGNIIVLTDSKIGVVEACSGLKMLMVFIALCTGAALLIRERLAIKLVIFFSAAPIAILTNIARITVTAVLHETVDHALADRVFHDLAGLLMMPIAFAMLFAELKLLEYLFVDVSGPVVFDFAEERPSVSVHRDEIASAARP